MSNVEKLKKKAAEFEQKKQFDRALEVYVQIIALTKDSEDRDVTVYNRVGDLNLRLNKTDQAVHYYEQAVDLYAEGGYLNNAIALCNKILRHAPSRNNIYYKLGKISAQKGFNSDAKKNFLEYADRMHKAGRDTDAFQALEEFANLCPGQDDIRLMLAEQLAKAGKRDEAVEQLQILHEALDSEGRTTEANAAIKRIHTLDPTVEPRRSKTPRATESGGLVFLDLGGSPPRSRPKIAGLERTSLAPEPPPRPRTPTHVQPSPEIEMLDLEPTTPEAEIPALEIDTTPVADLEPTVDPRIGEFEIAPLEGLESVADPASFDLAIESGTPEPTVESLITEADQDGIDSPFGTDRRSIGSFDEASDPLAGLSLLEDDRFLDDNPLAGVRSALEPPLPSPPPPPSASAPAATEEEPLEIEPLKLDVEEVEPPRAKPSRVESPRLRPLRQKPAAKEPEPVEPPEPVHAEGKKSLPFNPFLKRAAEKKKTPRLKTPRAEARKAPTPQANPPQRGSDNDDFVDLANWMNDDSRPRSTRMVAADDNRVGEEQADFTDMLEKFKAGVAANVDEEDFDSHYDLGVAYREMGLIDEAVTEFQKALRGATQRIRAYEALGQCFIDRSEFDVAITVLSRALREPGLEDEDLIAVLYLLGFAAEKGRKPREAAAYYQRVFAIDVDFRDVSKRLKAMSKAAST